MQIIHMLDLKSQYEKIQHEINTEIQAVLQSAAFIQGEKVSEFQRNLEVYLGVRHVIPVGNGTDALQIALMALGLEVGDEVIIPAFTFVSTAEVVALLGLIPVFVDVDCNTYTISVEAVKKAITPRTRAIIPVHLFGQNANMETLLQLAKEHNLFVVEDACQSIGAEYTCANGEKKQSGCMGDCGCTSFFPSKNLGCYGDGGAIFTNNNELAHRMRTIANHGMKMPYHYEMIGVNSRLDSLQAAVLNVKLKHLPEYTAARQLAADFYDNALANNKKIKIPARNAQSIHVFNQYTIQLIHTETRNALQQSLAEQGIPTRIYYSQPLHTQNAYSNYKAGDCTVAEKLCPCVLSLPMHTELTSEQLQHIVNAMNKFFD
jgi:dTDP-4-amino-4,6-dideoxygalactose transaminase